MQLVLWDFDHAHILQRLRRPGGALPSPSELSELVTQVRVVVERDQRLMKRRTSHNQPIRGSQSRCSSSVAPLTLGQSEGRVPVCYSSVAHQTIDIVRDDGKETRMPQNPYASPCKPARGRSPPNLPDA